MRRRNQTLDFKAEQKSRDGGRGRDHWDHFGFLERIKADKNQDGIIFYIRGIRNYNPFQHFVGNSRFFLVMFKEKKKSKEWKNKAEGKSYWDRKSKHDFYNERINCRGSGKVKCQGKLQLKYDEGFLHDPDIKLSQF